MNTPSSSLFSSSSSSSNCSIKSPTQKKQRKTKLETILCTGNETNPSAAIISTTATPLTPPPSVTQENLSSLLNQDSVDNKTRQTVKIDAFGNHLNPGATFGSNILAYRKAIDEPDVPIPANNVHTTKFKQPNSLKSILETSSVLSSSLTVLPILDACKSSYKERRSSPGVKTISPKANPPPPPPEQSIKLLNSDEPASCSGLLNQGDEFPKSLEELLLNQWNMGADLVAEQSQNFDGK